MQIIPVQALESQTLGVTLDNQNCSINIYQKNYGLFLDLSVSNALVIGGVICLDEVRIVRNTYLGFVGDLAFYDTQGTDDPVYTGLGARWQLLYLEEADIAAALNV